MRQECKPTCAIYARLRAGGSRRELAEQVEAMARFGSQLGWVPSRRYVDEAPCGTSGRDEFERMLHDAGEGNFGFVLFWCLAQFSLAGPAGTLEYLRRLDGNGVMWRSYTEPYLDSNGRCRDAVLSVFSILGAHERTVISERTVAGLERARAAGRTGGRPRLSLDAVEVARLRNEGLTLTAIAARLGTSKSSVHRIVKGE